MIILITHTEFIDANLEQRPQYKGSFADDKITLHDAVMIDDPQRQEVLLNKVLTTYEQAHGEKLMGLSGSLFWIQNHHPIWKI